MITDSVQNISTYAKRVNMKIRKYITLAIFMIAAVMFSACAAPSTGPKYHDKLLPEADKESTRLIVFRDYAEPTGFKSEIVIDGEKLLALPQQSYGFVDIAPGEHLVKLGWQGSMNSSEETMVFEPGKSYYFQVEGVSAPFVFHSKLVSRSKEMAEATMVSCCRLVDELAGSVSANALEESTQTYVTKVNESDFAKVHKDDSPDRVVELLGKPSRVDEGSTGKEWIPFYFGSDTRRIRWIYPGVGYISFSRHEYSGSIRVVEIVVDKSIK